MPEFHMNGKEESEFTALPEMVQGFIEAMFWTNTACESSANWWKKSVQNRLHEGQLDGVLPNDIGFAELHPDALAKIVKYCAAFEVKAGKILQDAYERDYNENQAGIDLWLTSNGHGAGFWDRDELKLRDNESEEYERLTAIMVEAGYDKPRWHEALAEREKLISLGDKLSTLCRYNEMNPYYAEDGFVYLD